MADEKPHPFTEAHPAFKVRGWREVLGENEEMAAVEAARHFIITGETGSGKSISAVMPLLEGALRYPEPGPYAVYRQKAGQDAEERDHLRPAVLVVDPKHELSSVVAREAAGRTVTTLQYGTPGERLYFLEGKDVAAMGAAEVVDTIVAQSDYYTRDLATTREPIWSIQAANVIKDFVAIDMFMARQGLDSLSALWDRVRADLKKHSEYAPVCPALHYNRDNYFKPIAALIAYAMGDEHSYPLAAYLDACLELSVPGELTARLVTLLGLALNTRSCVVWMVNGILCDIASDAFAACVSLNPIEPPSHAFSVQRMLEDGGIMVYIPTVSPSAVADTVGRCLKAKFLEFVFTRKNKVRPFLYIVDEAHRFITAGEQDGEQSLLDRCRAYRTVVVLSTQSIASLKFRLADDGQRGAASLQVMLNNCGNALYFRSSDTETQQNVEARIPGCPMHGRPHVVKVRPLTSLPTGSCYTLRANGTWGIFHVRLQPPASCVPVVAC